MVSRIFFRPVSLPISYWLHNMGVSADAVSVLVILMGLAGVFSIMANHSLAGFLLIELSFLFDHVDGNLARCQRRSTLQGGYLDFLGHLLVNPGLFFALGAYVSRAGGAAWLPLAAGALCALSVSGAGMAAKDRIMLDTIDNLKSRMRTPEVVRAFSFKPWLEAGQDGVDSSRLERFAARFLAEHLLFPGWLLVVPFGCVIQSWTGIPIATYILGGYTCLTGMNTIRTTVRYYRLIQVVDQGRHEPSRAVVKR